MMRKVISKCICSFICICPFICVGVILICVNAGADTGSKGYLVKVKDTVKGKIDLFGAMGVEVAPNSNLYFAENEYELNKMKQAYDVEYFEPNYKMELFDTIDDPLYSEQWNLDMMNAKYAWDIGCYGNDVKIAVIDSGIAPHVDLSHNVLQGYNFLGENIDEQTNTYDDIGHGTFVSGLIAGEMNEVGMVGVSNMAKIVPLKCFNSKSTYLSNIIPAIYAAVDLYDCDILNLSFGGYASESLKTAIDYAVSKGAIIVSAVGNYGSINLYYPAAYPNVIGVSSVDSSKQKAKTAQYNSSVFVTAPGENVTSLDCNNGYTTGSGTSYSAPMVTAMAAIGKNIKQDMTLDEFKQLLIETSEDLGQGGYDTSYGYGLVNIESFINKLLENKNVYVSKIDNRSGVNKIKIFNNTQDELKAVSIFAGYNNQRLGNLQITDIEVPPKKVETVTYRKNDEIQLKHFLWDSLSAIRPITLKGE